MEKGRDEVKIREIEKQQRLLRVEHLSKEYGRGETKVMALSDVSFCVQKGEMVAITGTSGSGKSTLLHLLGGVDDASEGSVYIGNTDLFSLSESKRAVFRRRYIGLIYQFYNLVPILNVEENLVLPLVLDGKPVNEKRMNQLLELLGLQERREHLPSQLSGGQQQRVSIGRALMTGPKLILADEPTGNLDQQNTREIMRIFHNLNQKMGQTIVMITHDMELARECHRILRLEDGKLVSEKRRNRKMPINGAKTVDKREKTSV